MKPLFETNTPGFPLPNWGLLTTNRLQVFILDFTGGNGGAHVIDYVNLEWNNSHDLNAQIFTDPWNGLAPPDGIWNTNVDALTGVPYGIENQINVSRGLAGVPATEDGLWQGDQEAFRLGTTPPAEQASFQAFCEPYGVVASVPGWAGYPDASASNYMASVVAPYAPTRYAVNYTILQANDPLVHHLVSDMTLSLPPYVLNLPLNYNNHLTNIIPLTGVNGLNLDSLNVNYQPWGGNPLWSRLDQNRVNLAERDPMVIQPDDWNFPDSQTSGLAWLGRVHRGTPWQTLYLKSPDILTSSNGLRVWTNWTGDADAADATAMAPVQDWHLASLLAAMLNTNDLRSLFSVNNPNPAAWQSLLDGLIAMTNSLDSIVISSNSPQASIIAYAIQTIRSEQPNQLFRDAGDVFATPELSTASPFLNTATANTISDEAYEAIPAQLLSLIRADSIGVVLSTNGQEVIRHYGL